MKNYLFSLTIRSLPHWQVELDAIEASVVAYSSNVNAVISGTPFNYGPNKTPLAFDILNANQLYNPDISSNITNGIQQAIHQLALGRQDANKKILLFTASSDPADIALSSSLLKQHSEIDIIIVILGITPDKNFLSMLPNVVQFFHYTNDVDNSVPQINSAFCIKSTTAVPKTTPQTATTIIPSLPLCAPQTSIVFAIDSSLGNNHQFYTLTKQFITNKVLAQNYSDVRRIGAIGYDNTANPQISAFNSFISIDDLLKEIQSFKLLAGSASITNGLYKIREQFTRIRPYPLMQTILFTTSDAYLRKDIIAAIPDSVYLQEMGQLIIVSLGTNTKKDLLQLSRNVLVWNPQTNDDDIASTLGSLMCNFPLPPTETPLTTTPRSITTHISASSTPITSKQTTLPPSTTIMPTTTLKPEQPYYPCKGDVVIAIDSSSDVLNADDFNDQINFIYNVFINQRWTHFERLAVPVFSAVTTPFYTFNTMHSYADVQNNINTIKQSPGFGLANLLDTILNLQRSIPTTLSTFVFVSETDQLDINNAIPLAEKLLALGNLNIIVMGTKIKSALLQALKPTNLFMIPDLRQISDTFSIKLMNAMACNMHTTASFVPSSSLAVTTQPSYYPVKSGIIIAIDSSTTLTATQFLTQLKFVSNDLVTNQWNHYERIALVNYNQFPDASYAFGTINTENEFTAFVNQIKQYDGSNLGALLSSLITLNQPLMKVNTYVFVSSLDHSDLPNCVKFAQTLMNQGSLTFISLGLTVNQVDLSSIPHSNIIVWSDLSVIPPDLAAAIIGSMVSDNTQTSMQPTPSQLTTSSLEMTTQNMPISSIQTTIGSSSTMSNPVTTMQMSTSTGTYPAIYPCSSNIMFTFDSSTNLSPIQFTDEINLVKNNVIDSNWNNYERIGITWYDGKPTTFYGFGEITTKSDFDLFVDFIEQRPGSNLANILKAILKIPLNTNISPKLSTFIFVSSLDDGDIKASIPYANQLKQLGSINFILIGDNSSVDQLKPLSPSSNTIKSKTSVYAFQSETSETDGIVTTNLFEKDSTADLRIINFHNGKCMSKNELLKKLGRVNCEIVTPVIVSRELFFLNNEEELKDAIQMEAKDCETDNTHK
uniref:VWFA domain-containing protein n=1 Tax=Rhabditophanes sp. KR3021 TaxID=114890 RepID=A0AC35UHP8_9BILA